MEIKTIQLSRFSGAEELVGNGTKEDDLKEQERSWKRGYRIMREMKEDEKNEGVANEMREGEEDEEDEDEDEDEERGVRFL